jgi:hypothetical protein
LGFDVGLIGRRVRKQLSFHLGIMLLQSPAAIVPSPVEDGIENWRKSPAQA